MTIDLSGRKAIVTGSTAGIGRATAEGLARDAALSAADDRPRLGPRRVRQQRIGGQHSQGDARLRHDQDRPARGVAQDEAEQGFLAAMRPTSLLGRFATTDEVANMIVYVCAQQASATSGAALRVDGGVVRFAG